MRDTIDMAREAAGGMLSYDAEDQWRLSEMEVMRLVELVRADEREKYKWDIHSCGPTCKRYACVAMREAVEAENEACAKHAEDFLTKGRSPLGRAVGDAIRARRKT